MQSQPLAGVKVLEVAQYFLVPSAGAVLADWGAEVIKVEHAVRGDTQRSLATRWRSAVVSRPAGQSGDDEFRPVYEQGNRGKRSIGLDLAHPAGRAVLTKLIEASDVFLTNFLPKSREKLSLDVEDVRAANPSIIYAVGSGNGPRGADRDQGGFEDTSFWARAGVAGAATPPDYPSVLGTPAPAFGDAVGGAALAGGIAAALYQRAVTGEAATVDVSLLGVGLWSNGGATALSLSMDAPWTASLVTDDCSVPGNPLFGAYRTHDDRWIFLCMPRINVWWKEVCTAIGRSDLVDDPRFGSFQLLQENAEEARQILRGEFGKQDFADWLRQLEPVRGGWSPVWNTLEAAADKQVVANNYLAPIKDPSRAVEHHLVRSPVEFDGSPPELDRAPRFAEHTDQILADLGYSMAEGIDLKILGAVT